MKTLDGNYVMCIFTGKICYTEREAGIVINANKKHHYFDGGLIKSSYGNSKNVPRRKYFCKDCGFYHVTHQAFYSEIPRTAANEEAFYIEFEKKKKFNRSLGGHHGIYYSYSHGYCWNQLIKQR